MDGNAQHIEWMNKRPENITLGNYTKRHKKRVVKRERQEWSHSTLFTTLPLNLLCCLSVNLFLQSVPQLDYSFMARITILIIIISSKEIRWNDIKWKDKKVN